MNFNKLNFQTTAEVKSLFSEKYLSPVFYLSKTLLVLHLVVIHALIFRNLAIVVFSKGLNSVSNIQASAVLFLKRLGNLLFCQLKIKTQKHRLNFYPELTLLQTFVSSFNSLFNLFDGICFGLENGKLLKLIGWKKIGLSRCLIC